MTTSKQLTFQFTEDKSTSLQEVFHANHSHLQESEKVQTMTDISGRKCLEQLEKFSHATLWAKMFMASLIGMEGWYSSKCKLTWKIQGTKYRRLYFRLVPSTPRTEGIGVGLLPTVTTQETSHYEAEITETGRRLAANGKSHSLNLADYAMRGMLPTPTANEDAAGTLNGKMQFMLTHAAKQMDMDGYGKGSQLNPHFVAEMMGFPINWTELPFLSGETKA